MATTHSTPIARGGQFSGWKLWALLAGAALLVATLAGRGVFTGGADLAATETASVHNLIEGIDALADSVAGVFDPPSTSNLLEGVDESAPVGAADVASGIEIRPNLPEGIDGPPTAEAIAGDSAYTAYKVEQANSDFQGYEAPAVSSAAKAGAEESSVLGATESKAAEARGSVEPLSKAGVASGSVFAFEHKQDQIRGEAATGTSGDDSPHIRNLTEGP